MILKTKTKIFIARMLLRGLMILKKDKSSIVEAKRNGIVYRLDLMEGIDLAIFLGVYEVGTIRAYTKIIKEGDHVVDVGANIGAHTLRFADLVGGTGKVTAFEPTDYAFGKLSRNVQLNPRLSPRIVLNQMMLMDTDRSSGPMPQVYSSWPLVQSEDVHPGHFGKKMETAHATSTTLDTYIEMNGIPKVDFMKIDVDGYEYQVLKGAVSTIKRCHPVIIMELSPYVLKETGHNLGEILDVFGEVGYRMKYMNSGRPLPSDIDSLMKLIPEGASQNIIACRQ